MSNREGASRQSDSVGSSGRVEWPPSRLLPSFPEPERLSVVEVGDVDPATELLLTTLQGAVNRERPRLYLVTDVVEGGYTWLRDLDVPYETLSGPDAAIDAFVETIDDLVVYDPELPATVNVATTIAGVRGGAVAHPSRAASLTDAYDVSIATDLRGSFDDAVSAYRWQYEEYWSETADRVLVGLPPTAASGEGPFPEFRDYAVATGSLAVWLDVNDDAQRAHFVDLLEAAGPDAGYLGWFPEGVDGEFEGVELCSEREVYVAPTDFANNMTVFGGVSAETDAGGETAESPADTTGADGTAEPEDAVYVTLTMTEGDNLQYNQHRMREQWDDAARGDVPINWSISPLLADAAPSILSFYRRTASANDHLLCGPSGAGYTYPSPWPDESFDEFAETTSRYMDRAGLDSMYLLNRQDGEDVPLSEAAIESYTEHVAPAGVVLNFWPGRDAKTSVGEAGLPVAVGPFVDSAATLAETIRSQAADWEPDDGPRFLAIGILAWDMTPTDVAAGVEQLGDAYEVVGGDRFFELVRATADPEWN